MAVIQTGLLAGVAGRVGQVVVYNRMGRWCVRQHVEHIRDARTPAQLRQRGLFRAMMQTASAMRDATALGLRGEARALGLVDSNLFLRLNKDCFTSAAPEADGQGSQVGVEADGRGSQVVGAAAESTTRAGGTGQTGNTGRTGGGNAESTAAVDIDYSRLQLSAGPVATVRFTRAAVDDGRFEGRFERTGGAGMSNGTDRVQVYVYCPDLAQGFLSLPVYRMDRRIAFVLPDAMRGHTLHCYAFCTSSDDVLLASPTAYIALSDSSVELSSFRTTSSDEISFRTTSSDEISFRTKRTEKRAAQTAGLEAAADGYPATVRLADWEETADGYSAEAAARRALSSAVPLRSSGERRSLISTQP